MRSSYETPLYKYIDAGGVERIGKPTLIDTHTWYIKRDDADVLDIVDPRTANPTLLYQ